MEQMHSLQKTLVKLPDKVLGGTQEIFKVAMDLNVKLQPHEYTCSWLIHLLNTNASPT